MYALLHGMATGGRTLCGSRAPRERADVVDSEGLRKRLDGLNRKPLPREAGSDVDREEIRRRIRKLQREDAGRPVEAIRYSRDVPRVRAQRPPAARWPAALPGAETSVRLEDAGAGAEVEAPDGGRAYLIETRLDEAAEQSPALWRTFGEELARAEAGLRARIEAACGAEGAFVEDVLFLDVETTGLGSTPLFLIGTLVWEGGAPVVQQWFARDYSEERAVISLFLEGLGRKRLLISFNGRTFDLPYVRVRAAANGLPFRVSIPHLDMLHECRRVWRHVLPDCKLQTLKNRVCGRARAFDIPGSEIPDAYHGFVRTGDAAQIVRIVQHNMMDLVTLAELMARLASGG